MRVVRHEMPGKGETLSLSAEAEVICGALRALGPRLPRSLQNQPFVPMTLGLSRAVLPLSIL
jgi:hypothetical protein